MSPPTGRELSVAGMFRSLPIHGWPIFTTNRSFYVAELSSIAVSIRIIKIICNQIFQFQSSQSLSWQLPIAWIRLQNCEYPKAFMLNRWMFKIPLLQDSSPWRNESKVQWQLNVPNSSWGLRGWPSLSA